MANLTDQQYEIWAHAVQLSRNGQAWRLDTLREELIEKDGFAVEDVDTILKHWANEERGKFTPEELKCTQRAMALSRHATATEKSVRFKLVGEGYEESEIETAINVCHDNDLLDGRAVNWEPAKP